MFTGIPFDFPSRSQYDAAHGATRGERLCAPLAFWLALVLAPLVVFSLR
jgi:hypothetical protein